MRPQKRSTFTTLALGKRYLFSVSYILVSVQIWLAILIQPLNMKTSDLVICDLKNSS